MKKMLFRVCCLALLLALSSAAIFPVISSASSAQTVLHATFEEADSAALWTVVNNGSSVSRSTDYAYAGSHSLKLSTHSESWYSPAYNIYPLIEEYGAGTYHFSMYVLYAGNTQETTSSCYMMIRGTEANSFIQLDESGNYFKRISNSHSVTKGEWRLLTGSIKVLKSDLIDFDGEFIFCIDSLPAGSNTGIYIDELTITKYSDEEITNGNFNSGVTGWRAWNENGATNNITISEYNGLFMNYLRVDEYGSIACNVDQILSYYGPGEYTLSLKMKCVTIPIYDQPFTFYLTTNFSDYHKWLAQKSMNDSNIWYTISIPFTITDSEFFNNLSPDEKEVHFRIQSPESYAMRYYIDDVSLTPTALTSFQLESPVAENGIIDLNTLSATPVTSFVQVVSKTSYNAPSRCTWRSSDNRIASISGDGIMKIKLPGRVTITATSHNGNITSTITFTIIKDYQIPGFTFYGQERAHLCWAACTKMVAHQIAKNEGYSTAIFGNTLQNDIVSAGFPADKDYGNYFDMNDLLDYYIGDEFDLMQFDNKTTPESVSSCTVGDLIYDIDENLPVIIGCHKVILDNNGNEIFEKTGHVYVVYGYYYNGSDYTFRIWDPNKNNQAGGTTEFKFNDMINGRIEGYVWCYYDHVINS